MNGTFQYLVGAFAKDNVLKADIKKLRVVIKIVHGRSVIGSHCPALRR
jgi:hypothetical protein